MGYQYCPLCGRKLKEQILPDEGFVPYCDICKKPYFNSSGLCALVAIFNERNEVILTKQSHISDREWVLVSGFVKQGEDIENTIEREVEEEIGLKVRKQIYISSFYDKPSDLLILGFAAFVDDKQTIKTSDEIDQVSWFEYNKAMELIWKGSIAEQLLRRMKKIIYM